MKNRDSTPILTDLVGVRQRNIHTKFEANLYSGSREEVEKVKKKPDRQTGQRQQRTQGDR